MLCCVIISNAKQPSCGAPPKSHNEKRCEIQVGGQEMAVMVSKWQKFNNNNSGEFVLPPPIIGLVKQNKYFKPLLNI